MRRIMNAVVLLCFITMVSVNAADEQVKPETKVAPEIKKSGEFAKSASAAKVAYTVVGDGYFVMNTLAMPTNGISCHWLETQDDFDGIFQKTPPLMNSKRKADVSLTDSVAVAVIYECKAMPVLKVTAVTVKNGILTVAYGKKMPKNNSTAVFTVPLIVQINKTVLEKAGSVKTVKFIENGREVGTASRPEKK